jgi:hypothetical protein
MKVHGPIADQLHRVAADATAVLVHLVVFDRDHLYFVFFEERPV